MPLPFGYQSTRGFRATKGKNRHILPPCLLKQTFTNPSTADTDGISASHAGAAAAGTTNSTIGGALATAGVATLSPPRNVVITVTHATAVVAMSGVITGTDRFDQAQTEDWSVTATGTSKAFTGKKAFKTVTSVTEVVAADASANSIIIGDGAVLGIESPASVAKLVAETLDGAVVTNGTIVVASAISTEDLRGTYAPNSAPNGARTYVIYYISDAPEMYR